MYLRLIRSGIGDSDCWVCIRLRLMDSGGTGSRIDDLACHNRRKREHKRMVNMITLNSRDEWLKCRKNRIGGSDAAAILGKNPYMSNVDL